MKEELSRIEGKLDKIAEDLSAIKGVAIGQAADIKYHIKRTDLIEAQLQPIEKHVAMVQGALKFIGLIALLGGILSGVVEFLTYLKDLK